MDVLKNKNKNKTPTFSSQYSRGCIIEDIEAESPHLTSKVKETSLSSLNTRFIANLHMGNISKQILFIHGFVH